MSGFHLPNTTQVPDALFDVHMRSMGDAELRVTLYLIRQTFGWRRTWSKGQFCKPARIAEHTGLSAAGVRIGIKAGMERGTIERKLDDDARANHRSYVYSVAVSNTVILGGYDVDPYDVDPYQLHPCDAAGDHQVDPCSDLSVYALTPTVVNTQVERGAKNAPPPMPALMHNGGTQPEPLAPASPGLPSVDGNGASAGGAGAAQPKPKRSARNGKAPQPPEYHALIAALAEVCRLDLATIPQSTRVKLDGAAKSLLAASVTADFVQEVGVRWYSTDWRGKQGKKPTLAQLQEEIGDARLQATRAPGHYPRYGVHDAPARVKMSEVF